MMKRILMGMLLALPLAVASFPLQASAAKIVVIPSVHKPKVAPRPVIRQKLIPGHWEKTPHGRRWVPAHYVRIK